LKNLPLHTKIILGIVTGILFGLVAKAIGLNPEITIFYIKPFGTIFINLLLMVALPLVMVSLITGIAQLGDINKFSRMGTKTIGLYLFTTFVAISLGLLLTNIISPGKMISPETRDKMEQLLNEQKEKTIEVNSKTQPLQPLIDIVPKNIIEAASENTQMLQIVFFAMLLGIALIKIPKEKAKPVIAFFDGLNEAIVKLIDMIMLIAPYGVFSLIAALIAETSDPDLLIGVAWYSLVVLLGLMSLVFIFYPLLLKIGTNISYKHFFVAMRPALLLAFSTSSSSATLPVTIRCAEKNLGIPEEVSGFVLPLGATINMDGTSLYQGVAAIFIAQVFNMDLSITDQLTVLFTALLASIGTAGVPGAGIVMLIIVLKSVGIPVEGIALILAPDRILDMCRTLVNVTSDATVAAIVASKEGRINN
jgi:proton glutamate symport protein